MSATDYTVLHVGESQQPVVVLDDFHPHADHLRQMAAQSTFRKSGPYYPGVQAPADARHLDPVRAKLSAVFQDVFNVTDTLSLVQCSFSKVTVPDADLAPIQRLPHVDTTDPGRFALLHYLSGTQTGGTAFYRHRKTGLETLTSDIFETYKAALNAEGDPKPGYMRGSDDRFEMIGSVESKPNRAVLYRSHLLHSGMIPQEFGFDENPNKARLTVNSFFQVQGA